MPKLKYDGRYDWIPGESRQWTILTDFIDQNGANRRKGSFSLQGLKDIGLI